MEEGENGCGWWWMMEESGSTWSRMVDGDWRIVEGGGDLGTVTGEHDDD